MNEEKQNCPTNSAIAVLKQPTMNTRKTLIYLFKLLIIKPLYNNLILWKLP